MHRAGKARHRGSVQTIQALQRCAGGANGLFKRGGRSEIARTRGQKVQGSP